VLAARYDCVVKESNVPRACAIFNCASEPEHRKVEWRKNRRNPNNRLAQGKIQEVIMGAEYVGGMGGVSFDHDVTRIVAGDAESLRARLAGALEQMGYRVLNENPIQARRGASGLARSGCSQDILDYRRSLDIDLAENLRIPIPFGD
jgi:hypothetical protein